MPKVKTRISLGHTSKRRFAVQDNQTVTLSESAAAEDTPTTNAQRAREKRKLRRERWLEKLNASYGGTSRSPESKNKKSKKRNTDSEVMRLDYIKAALPTLDFGLPGEEQQQKEQSSSKSSEKQKPTNAVKAVSQKSRRKANIGEIIRMQKILDHDAFKKNPLATIQQHVRNTMVTEQQEQRPQPINN
ncbi:hypothetical protein HK102_002832 [Quaeritorhiza haematococci]|nr:hypothetical protein HK102_002832 [Quaeritorhiza haematococci]